MKIGFTGNRHGMTAEQKFSLCDLLIKLAPSELHMGDCVGSDDEAAKLSQTLVSQNTKPDVISHPPSNPELRAYNKYAKVVKAPVSYYNRNRNIVNDTEVMIAAPNEFPLPPKGGTVMTLGLAQKKGKLCYVIWPNGQVDVFHPRKKV